ncbi:MAG: hypothetical protein E7404_06335 [Ruminococcaceae bacterium]|nr:hypothetical protein [Oscillospiraceae bacterium]
MKKIISLLICLFIVFNMLTFSVYAYKFPNSFWKINDAYQAALDSGDDWKIVHFGEETTALIRNEPENEQTLNVLASRYEQVAKSYAKLGEFDKSAQAYKNFIPYGEKLGWSDSVKIANASILQYESDVKIYTDNGNEVFYGAKNEHTNGVLFGSCSDANIRQKLSNESMMILYHELNEGITDWQKMIMDKANDSDIAVEFALNCKNEGWDIDNIHQYDANLSNIAAFLNNYPDMKIFLRFAAEFDVWTTIPESQSFVSAYRYVSDFFKSKCKNVAMVWSLNHVSNWDINIDDYYPGDEYVDWVGMSSYYQKYFKGEYGNDDGYTEVVFKTGINSEPYLAVKNIVEKYGNRKPIMISESGFSHYANKIGVDTTAFALERMEDFYTYLPIMYPQIKLIAYFDKSFGHESDDYSIPQVSEIEKNYLKYTKSPRFIQDSENNISPVYYSEINESVTLSNIVNLFTYSHIYGEKVVSAEYYIGSTLVATSNKKPFIATIDLSQFENGHHLLCVKTYTESGKVWGKEMGIKIENNLQSEISVVVNGQKLSFDAPAFIYNNRTFVPLRAIFEALGASVEWNGAAKTVTATKGETQVMATINDYVMTKNNETKILDAFPMIVSSRTFVPVRAIAQSFDCNVNWNSNTKTVEITG